jgi:MerR family copper efflux transcriptional regulator
MMTPSKSIVSKMTIGQAAKKACVNAQTFRYYEKIGLLKPTFRRESGYRVYDEDAVKKVFFIKRAQELGFSLDEVRELLLLRFSSSSAKLRVRKKAEEKISAIRSKIRDLKKMEATLTNLVTDCELGELSGPCPILAQLEGNP